MYQTIVNQVMDLVAVFGWDSREVARLLDVDITEMNSWIKDGVPDDKYKQRAQVAYDIVALFPRKTWEETAEWFRTASIGPDGITPFEAIRTDRFEEVMEIARQAAHL